MDIDQITTLVCDELKLLKETCLLPHPYGDYKYGRTIIAKLSDELKIDHRIIADKLMIKKKDHIATLIHDFKMKIDNFPEALVNDKYKKCKNKMLINL